MATPRVAAGALFFDNAGRVLLVKPTYKNGWDIPGGYVEPGESPRAACIREVYEELGLMINAETLLVVDWAPAENEGDKMLFVFDAGILSDQNYSEIQFIDGELADSIFVTPADLEQYLSGRLHRRLRTAIEAKQRNATAYAEHGNIP